MVLERQRYVNITALQRAYQCERLQVWGKWLCTGTARITWLFHVHRERAKGFELHVSTVETLQSGEGINHPKEVVEVPERNTEDVEVNYSCKCREQEREAGMKREVL